MEKNTSPEAPKGSENPGQSAIEKLKALAKANQEKRASAEKGAQVDATATLDESAKEAARMEQGNVKLATKYVSDTKMFLSQEEGGARVPLAYNKESDVLRAKEAAISSEVEELRRTIKDADDLISSPHLPAGGDEESTKLFEDARAELQTMRENLVAKEGELAQVKKDRSGLTEKWTRIAKETQEAMKDPSSFAAEEVLKSKDPKFNKDGGWEISEVDPGESKKVAEKIPGALSKERREKHEEFETQFEQSHITKMAESYANLEAVFEGVSARIDEATELLEDDADKVRGYNSKLKKARELRNKKYGFLTIGKDAKKEVDLKESDRLVFDANEIYDEMEEVILVSKNPLLAQFDEVAQSILHAKKQKINLPNSGDVEVNLMDPTSFGFIYENNDRRARVTKQAVELKSRAEELMQENVDQISAYRALLIQKMPR